MSDGILSRWSRRKRAVQAAEEAARQAAPRPPEAETSLPVVPGADLPEVPADAAEADALAEAIARLPKLEDLTAQTDLAPFLRAGIPSALRNAALRKMWSVDPGIRDFVSEAREYAYDWNTPGGVPGLGPMLPTDDIKAMVERVMTGHAPVVPAEPGPDGPDPDEPEPPGGPGGPPEVEIAAVAPPDPVEPVPQAASNPSQDPVETFQSPTIVSRLRRHGGAMPS